MRVVRALACGKAKQMKIQNESWQWDANEPDAPLILHENEARRYGASEESIAAAKLGPVPCLPDWPVPQRTWQIYKVIPVQRGTWKGVTFVERRKKQVK